MKILFYDLETTGFGFKKCAIIQFAGIMADIGTDNRIRPLEAIDLKMQPRQGKMIDMRALEVNGYSLDEVMSWEDDNTAFMKLIRFLERHVDRNNPMDCIKLCGYSNSHFDSDFLMQWFADNGCSFCSYCAEYCPVDAMTVSPIVELAEYTRSDLIYGPRRLAYDKTTEGMKIVLEETLISDFKSGNGERRVKPFMIDRPELESSKCISCKKCAKVCPVNAINMVEHGTNAKGRPILWPEINNETCICCENCVDACPKDALHIKEVL